MTSPSGREWSIKYGWHAHFLNSNDHFTTGWIAVVVDIELKVDIKLFFTITPTSSILVKVLGMIEAMSSVDDKVDEDDYDNDIKEEDIIDDEYYKEKDEEEKDEDDEDDVDDDDDDKVVRLISMNEKHS
ncbi:unnamed protein product [Sphagnum jensenii]|uniref:TF-B3 domain-containing protein n=1 Tax=Sphagnum jensenii TaxID=128206 RepID=A0ABP0WGL3_9BRYO